MRFLFFTALAMVGFAVSAKAQAFHSLQILKEGKCWVTLSWDEAGNLRGSRLWVTNAGKRYALRGKAGARVVLADGRSWKCPIELRVGNTKARIRGTFIYRVISETESGARYQSILQGQINKPEIIRRDRKLFRVSAVYGQVS